MNEFPSPTLTLQDLLSPTPHTCSVANCFDSLNNCIRNLFPYQYLKSDIIVFNGCCVWICHNSFKQAPVFHYNEQPENEHPGTYVFALLTHYFLRMNSQKWNFWVTRVPHIGWFLILLSKCGRTPVLKGLGQPPALYFPHKTPPPLSHSVLWWCPRRAVLNTHIILLPHELLCTVSRSRRFTYINSLNPQNNLRRYVLLAAPLYRWGNCS